MSRFPAVLLASALLILAAPAYAKPERYEFDKAHTSILFFIDHLGFSSFVGKFMKYDGHFMFDQETPGNSSVDVTIDPAGIRTDSDELDRKLQGKEYFSTAEFPGVRFVSTGVKSAGPNIGEIVGNLTLRGVTRPVTLNVRFNKADYHPITKNFQAGFSAEGTFKRSDFGMTALIPMVGDEIRIVIEVEGINQDRKEADKLKK